MVGIIPPKIVAKLIIAKKWNMLNPSKLIMKNDETFINNIEITYT